MKRHPLCVFCLTFLLAPIACWADDTSAPSFLDRPLPPCAFPTDNLEREVRSICKTLEIPCGLEYAAKDGDPGIRAADSRAEISYAAHSGTTTVRKLLDLIVRINPSYQWRYADGVLTIRPKVGKRYMWHGRPRLERRVARLRIDAESCWVAAHKVLVASKATDLDIQNALPIRGTLFPHVFGIEPRNRVTIALDGERAFDALNAVVRAHGRAIWTFGIELEGFGGDCQEY